MVGSVRWGWLCLWWGRCRWWWRRGGVVAAGVLRAWGWGGPGLSGQRVEEQGTWASRTRKHSEALYGQPVDRGAWTAKTVKLPRQQLAQPQHAYYWAPLERKWHTMPHPAQPRHPGTPAPRHPGTPTTGLRERGNDTNKSTGRSGRQYTATRCNMRREERVTVQGPVKKQQPDGMSHHRGTGAGVLSFAAAPLPVGSPVEAGSPHGLG